MTFATHSEHNGQETNNIAFLQNIPSHCHLFIFYEEAPVHRGQIRVTLGCLQDNFQSRSKGTVARSEKSICHFWQQSRTPQPRCPNMSGHVYLFA